MGIGKGVDSRNLMSVARFEGENPATNLGEIPGQSKSSVIGQVWPAKNYMGGAV